MSKFETSGHIHEMKDGILHVYVKPGIPSIEDIKESMNCIAEVGTDLLILCDPNDATALDKDQRAFVAKEMEKYAKGFAMLNQTLMVPLVFNLVMKINKPTYPVKIFKTEGEAIAWLKSL